MARRQSHVRGGDGVKRCFSRRRKNIVSTQSVHFLYKAWATKADDLCHQTDTAWHGVAQSPIGLDLMSPCRVNSLHASRSQYS